MRLHVKLALILTGSMVALLSASQLWQVRTQLAQLQEQSTDSIRRLEAYEKANAHNVSLAAEHAVAGSLERGEMEKFQRALDAQRAIEGLMEFTLYSQKGEVAYSTSPSRLGEPFPSDRFDMADPGRQEHESPTVLEVLAPQPIVPDCIRCHYDWPAEGFGGALYMVFSRDMLVGAKQDAETAMASARKAAVRNSTIMVIALCTVLAGLVHLFLGRPLSRFVGMLDHFRTDPSDLTYRIPVTRQDEIGKLGQTLNAFLEQVHSIVRTAAGGAARVAEQSEEIASTNATMASQLSRQRDRTTQIAASTEEMAAVSREVARQCSQLADSARATGERSEQGGRVIHSAIRSMRDLAGTVNGASSLVNELEEHSRGIGGVVELIESVAGQTNLLALNATIEAARAGEHGRGFAVVAEEVRALAQRTQQATESISRSIELMAQVTQRSVAEMGRGASVADEVLGLAEEAGSVLQEITSGTASVSEAISGIAAAAEQQSATTGEIATNVDAIDTSTRENDEGAQRSAATSRSLREEALALQEQISRFRI